MQRRRAELQAGQRRGGAAGARCGAAARAHADRAACPCGLRDCRVWSARDSSISVGPGARTGRTGRARFSRYRREHNMRENKHFLILSCVTVWIGSFWFRIPVPSLRLRRGRSSVVRAGFRAAGRAAWSAGVQRDPRRAGATLTSDPTPVGVAPYGRPTRVRLRQQQHADRWRAFDTASRSIEQRLRYRRVPPVCTPNETSKRNRPGVKPSFSPVCSHDVPLGTRRLRLLPGDPCASSHRIESVSHTGTTST